MLTKCLCSYEAPRLVTYACACTKTECRVAEPIRSSREGTPQLPKLSLESRTSNRHCMVNHVSRVGVAPMKMMMPMMLESGSLFPRVTSSYVNGAASVKWDLTMYRSSLLGSFTGLSLSLSRWQRRGRGRDKSGQAAREDLGKHRHENSSLI